MTYEYSGMDGQKHSFNGGVLPEASRICAKGDVDEQTGALICPDDWRMSYNIFLNIGIDTTKTITTPTAGDTIGTLTLTFATN